MNAKTKEGRSNTNSKSKHELKSQESNDPINKIVNPVFSSVFVTGSALLAISC